MSTLPAYAPRQELTRKALQSLVNFLKVIVYSGFWLVSDEDRNIVEVLDFHRPRSKIVYDPSMTKRLPKMSETFGITTPSKGRRGASCWLLLPENSYFFWTSLRIAWVNK